VLACARCRSAPPSTATPRAALSAAGEEILRAVIPWLLTAAGRSRPEREQALDAGMLALDDYLAHLSLPLQAEAARVFDTLELLPARLLLLGTAQRWRDASPAAIERFLRSARDGRLLLLRRMAAFLQSMTVLAWFDQPAAWRASATRPAARSLGRQGERGVIEGEVHVGCALDRDLVLEGDVAIIGSARAAPSAPRSWHAPGCAC